MKKVLHFLTLCFLIPVAAFAQQGTLKKDRDGGPSRAVIFEINRTKDPATGKVPRDKYLEALQKTVSLKNETASRSTTAFTWAERGPISDVPGPSNGNTRANSGLASGRIRAVMVDSNDVTRKTVFIGGVNGGLWKTTDITLTTPTWTLVNDFFTNMAIAAICQDPRPGFTNIMYFCTGESYFNADAVQGNGVFKSIDGGVTWTYLASTSTFVNGTRILCDFQGNIYLATRGTGLRRSTAASGGAAWTNITPAGLVSNICDLEISSTSAAGRLHVVTGIFSTQAYRYTDIPATVASGTWTSPAVAFPSYSNRCEIAVSGSTLYACPVDNDPSNQVPTIYKSTNGGANWAATVGQPTAGWANGQGWYDMAVGIDPSNANNCIVGGLDNFKTTDGGTSWVKISAWVGAGQYVHADIHNIVWYEGGNKLIFASDGGVFYSTDKGTTIRDRNLGLRIKQFYSCAIHPTTTNYFLAGAQDNGNHQFSNAGLSTSIEVTGGDGAYVDIDQNQAQYQYGAYIFNTYRRSTNSGANWSSCNFYKGTSLAASNFGSFINPFDYDNTGNIIYAGADGGEFFRWTTAQTTASGNYFNTTGFPAGASIVTGITGFNGSNVSAVFVSPYTANLVYFGTAAGRVVSISGANTVASGAAGSNITGALFPPGATVSCINTGTNDNNLMVSFSNYGVNNVWVSTNAGTAWTAIDGNLPNMPVRWCMFYPGDNTKAIIATETGVWQTDLINGASTLWVAEPNFPTVRTDMLQYRASDGVIAAATHGRGLWTTSIIAACVPPPVSVSPTSSAICNPGGTAVTLTAIGASTYSWSPATGLSGTTGAVVTANPTVTTTYTVTGTDGLGCTAQATATVTVANKPTLVGPTATPATICSGSNSTLSASPTMPALTYCTPTYATGTGSGDWISLVQIVSSTLNNPTGAAATPFYTLYPASGVTTASLAANTSLTMNVSGGSFATCLIRGWIDYNQDGLFTAAETIGISPNVGAAGAGTIVFTIPLSAINGATRMRLRSSDTAPGPGTGDFCDATNSTFGETEDYVITITGGVAQFTYLWSPATFLSSTTTNPTTASSVSGTTTYNLTVSTPAGCTATGGATVTVTPNNTIGLTSAVGTNAQTRCINTAITNITYATTGATGATFSGLPAGVTGSWAANVATITGTPTAAGTFNYTVTLTGGCGIVTATGSIVVTPLNTASLTSAVGTNAQTRCINTAITNITYGTTGATGATFSGLPAGVTGSWAANVATITGTPTAAGTFNYTVTLTGGCGIVTATGSIVVTPLNTASLTSAVGTNAQTRCINTAITNITYGTTGATGATFSGLPAGVTGSWAANVATITGTPTAAGTFNYTVTLTGGCGIVTATGSIVVTPLNTASLTSAVGTNAQTRCINTAITNITYATTGATGATFSGLPAGVTGSWAANVATITGTPTAAGTFNYTVTLTGGCGIVTATGSIVVTPLNTASLTSAVGTNAQTRCINTAITNITYATTGATGATFSGLPAGVTGSWAANVATITGTPTAAGTFNYTVTLTGGCGIVTATGSIVVTPLNTASLTSAVGTNAQTRCINTAITNITYATTGATGATFSGLPAGVTGSWAANVATITGTPTAAGTFNYTVTLTGGCGTVTATGTITVTPNKTIVLTSAGGTNAQTRCINTAITNITYATTGATGATFSGLPAGVTGSWAANVATITGTPTAAGTFNYTVTLTGGCGTVTATGTITVTPNKTIVLTSAGGTNAQTVNVSTAITNITYATTGATGATFSGLPAGVTGNWVANVVTISGTPTVAGAFNYTVTLTGGCGTVTASGTITVTATGITVNLKLFLEGYYIGGSTMQPVLNNHLVPSSLATQADTIIIDLHHPTTFVLIDSKKAVLLTNGTVSATFTQAVGSYYIGIRHRSTVQTWSAAAVACTASTPLYDFSTAANKAYADNQIQVQTNIWAFFTGDINQDEFIDSNDFPDLDNDIFNGVAFVYAATDLNGDGFVDSNDFPVLDNNIFNGVASIHP